MSQSAAHKSRHFYHQNDTLKGIYKTTNYCYKIFDFVEFFSVVVPNHSLDGNIQKVTKCLHITRFFFISEHLNLSLFHGRYLLLCLTE